MALSILRRALIKLHSRSLAQQYRHSASAIKWYVDGMSFFSYLTEAHLLEQAIFGTAWNAILFVALLVLERYELPIPTTRLRYEVEKAACIVAVVGNAIYSVACIALMATLARLAAIASSDCPGCTPQEQLVADSAGARRAGQGSTAAFAGLAA